VNLDPSGNHALKAVLFDLDGVLVDSFEVWRHLLNSALERHGRAPLDAAGFASVWGQGMEADIRMFFHGLTVDGLRAYYEENFSRHLRHLKVFTDARPVAETLTSRGLRLAVASNSTPRIIAETLGAAGLAPLFPVVVGAGGPLRGKPEPDVVLEALAQVQASPEEALFIGDSPYDMEAGERAGVATVGLGRDGGKWRIERLSELLELPPFNHSEKGENS
jgi:HAD superfamily hydrolase (TIGR01509 family)